MSMIYCYVCDEPVDTDEDVEHFESEEHKKNQKNESGTLVARTSDEYYDQQDTRQSQEKAWRS